MRVLCMILTLSLVNCQNEDVSSWTNGRYTTSRTKNPALGETLFLSAQVTGEPNEVWDVECTVTTPSGELWQVSFNNVYGEDGDTVPGVEGEFTKDQCWVSVASASEEHLGDWRFNIYDLIPTPQPSFVITTANLVTDVRLPTTFTPQHYGVRLIPDFDSTGDNITYEGSMTMSLESRYSDNNLLTFHMDELTLVGEPRICLQSNCSVTPVTRTIYDFQRTFVHLETSAPFLSGSVYELSLSFTADLSRGRYFTYGFYPQVCSETNGDPKLCWFTQGESTTMRNAFPCLDEPALKATFSLEIARTEDYFTRTNTPLVETVPLPEKPGYVLDRFETTPKMSAYLVAIGITDFVSLPSLDDSTTVWGPRDDIEAGRGDYANQIGSEIMSYYADYFNYWYPLPKMDLMYEAKKGGAMENWGLVLFAPRTIMLDADADDEAKWLVTNVISHELAHQWFGNLVTCFWWGQTWLNEGFATYVSYIGSEHLDPEASLHPWDRFYVREMQRVMKADQNTDTHWPMTDQTTDRGDNDRMFGTFSYQKGGSVVRMMEHILTKETFNKGLTAYLVDMEFSAASEDDLFINLEAVALEDGTYNGQVSFSEAMKSWTNQAGLPVVHVTKEGGDLTFNQRWLRNEETGDEVREWHIPLTYTSVLPTSDWTNTHPEDWLTPGFVLTKVDVVDADSPVVVNVQGTGYYRVNYDKANWLALASVLATDHMMIHRLNRAQIICDVAALYELELVSQEVRDAVLGYIDQETEWGPKYAYEQCVGGFRDVTGLEGMRI